MFHIFKEICRHTKFEDSSVNDMNVASTSKGSATTMLALLLTGN
jgi:hypothetical protein